VFDKVEALPNFPELEKRILNLWKERDVFHRSLAESKGRNPFVFYEGPPTANGLPHNGHVLTRVMKDLFPRYQTMRGYHVDRRAGWDTHGLPVEVEVEKELRIRGKEAIVKYGVEPFVRKCLESVFRYTSEWEHLTERIGFWVDLDQAYVTYHKSYVESVWWALSELFKKGLLYRGHKVVWWWAQGGTALSAGETGNAYKTVDDPSVYVLFPLVGEDASLVVWTTTPWTLPSNQFAAVHAEVEYAYAKDPKDGRVLVMARALLPSIEGKIGRQLEVLKSVKGAELIGKHYRPPFDTYAKPSPNPLYFRVVAGDKAIGGPPQWFVALDTGTGVVHMAPAFGEDDWKVWRKEQRQHPSIELLCAVRPDGRFNERLGALEGTWVKDADKPLVKMLEQAGLLLHHETYRHEYPFCWRSDNDPLIQYARDTWFIRTTAVIDQVMENNQDVVWLPDHIKSGRFGDFLAGNVDWALSRERFWGTPLNIWVCDNDQCGALDAPSSCAEIEAKNPAAFRAFHEARAKDPSLSIDLMVHKPWIDAVNLPCMKCGGTMRRVPEVIDCWFDSGCMPFAEVGYPHLPGSAEAFKGSFPADFISEAIDQTRGWFYSLMMISNLLFQEAEKPHPYKRCIVLGHVCDKYGKKESKSAGNYTPPEVILDHVRMGFAPVAKKDLAPKPGEALIARDDLEGLDLGDGASVMLYRPDKPDARRTVKLKAHPEKGGKKFPRRQVVLADEDRTALGLTFGPDDVRPAEVPTLSPEQRVWIEPEGTSAPGADAFRWFFYASNPPWSNTRHSLTNVRSLQKELPIKLRSVYAFFVTYANIDGFDPVKDEGSKRAVKERALLDRWILSELEKTKRTVTERMDAFLSYDAAQALSAFVESLSNWYVRRSRARFWSEKRDQDKLDAYWTLYQCLRDLSVYIAPFLPFATEDMYQNLVVRPFGKGPPDSVHLCLYPDPELSVIDEGLSRTMALLRDLVSLGLKVRTDNKLKVRQPLASVEIVLANPVDQPALEPYVAVMADELNVKAVNFAQNADAYVNYKVKPNFPLLGKKLGPRMKATTAALAAGDPNALKRSLDAAGSVTIDVDGEPVTLSAEEVQITVEAREGFKAAGDAAAVVVLDVKLTDALIEEGWYREVLSRIQGLRKDLELDYQARIAVSLMGDKRVQEACWIRLEDLKRETLAKDFSFKPIGGEKREFSVDGKDMVLEVVDLGVPSGRGGSGSA
jgi:isoleucyl-tRNA synthetase